MAKFFQDDSCCDCRPMEADRDKYKAALVEIIRTWDSFPDGTDENSTKLMKIAFKALDLQNENNCDKLGLQCLN